MTISEFKARCETLGRFASIKEKREPGPKNTATHKHHVYPIVHEAWEDGTPDESRPLLFVCKGCSKVWKADEINRQFDPTDKVFVQASKGTLKFVSGNADSTIVIDMGPTSDKAKLLVSSRLLLNAAKSLRGKGDVEFLVEDEAMTITTSTGGSVVLPSYDSTLPGWLKPQPTMGEPSIDIEPGLLADMAKVVDACSGNTWPWSHVSISVVDEIALIRASDKKKYACTRKPVINALMDGPVGAVHSTFFATLRGIKDGGAAYFTPEQFVVVAGPYVAASRLLPGTLLPSPEVFDGESTCIVTADKRSLTDMVKGVASNDEHNRVAMSIEGGKLVIQPYDNRSAKVAVSAVVERVDLRNSEVGVDAGVLTSALTAYPGTHVKVGWASGTSPIKFHDKDWRWQMYIAPVVS